MHLLKILSAEPQDTAIQFKAKMITILLRIAISAATALQRQLYGLFMNLKVRRVKSASSSSLINSVAYALLVS